MPSWIHRAFAPIKSTLPRWISEPIHSVATAALTPVLFSLRSGHLRSSFERAAVTPSGDPLPWYTYPAIDFLSQRRFDDQDVLEFGAGQSTLWWARQARRVVACEGDPAWVERLRPRVPSNVELHLVPADAPDPCLLEVHRVLSAERPASFDVVVIDGLWRHELIDVAVRMVKSDGIVICDNSEGYGFQEGFAGRDFSRVDFFGYAPGGVQPVCTSIFFKAGARAFAPTHPIRPPAP